MTPELVIFDCDGVLVDTEGPTNEVLAKTLSQYGPAISARESMARFVGGTMADVARRAKADGYNIPECWTEEIYGAMFDRLRQGIELIPGVVDVLDRLDASGIPYCVGSNGPMEKMDITLVQTGLMARLEGRIYSPHVIGLEFAKPSAGLYLHALKQMGYEAGGAVVIEDSASGARGAKNAGIRCFGYTAETKAEVLEAEGAIPFDDMAQLPDLLQLS